MSQDKQDSLHQSSAAAEKKFSTDKIIQGGCKECECETFVQYVYSSGDPVPNAPFVLTDSKGNKTDGQTDGSGYFKIQNMACNAYQLDIKEGSDDFDSPDTVENNPVLQANPAHAALAGEYFTLYLLLHEKGIVEYDAEDSERYDEVNVDDSTLSGRFFSNVEDKYQLAYDRFQTLKKQINAGDREFKRAINKIHHSLSAEVADQTTETAVLLLCQIILGFIPVVGQAPDVYFIGEWCWAAYKKPDNLEDNYFLAEGALNVVGVIPGPGHALKIAGKSVVRAMKALEKSALDNQAVQLAVREIRNLSNGNIVRWLMDFAEKINKEAKEAISLLNKIITAIELMVKNATSSAKSWIVAFAKDSFSAICGVIKKLINKFKEIVDEIIQKVNTFIGKIITRKSGSAVGKGEATKPEIKVADKTPLDVDGTPGHTSSTAGTADGKTCSTSNKCQGEGEPVDMATGYMVEWRTDFQLAGILPLAMKRYYRSGGERKPGLLGSLWRSNWDMSLTLKEGVVTLIDGEFNQAIFVLPVEGECTRSPSNPQWRLTRQQGRLILQDAGGLHYRFEHARGRELCLTSIEDRQDNQISLIWEFGVLRWVALPDKRLIHVETRRQRITCLTLCDAHRNPLKKLANYIYDSRGHLLSVRADEGRNFDYRYSPEGWLLRWSDLALTWVEHDYDKKGRVIRDRTSEGYWPGHFEYDDDTLTSRYYSGFGGVISYVRDERNNILLKRTPDGGETHFEWVDNQLVAETDPLGGRTTYQRNDWGLVTEVILPDGATHQCAYDDNGDLLAYTDPLGSEWYYQRNATGQVMEVNDPEGREWLYSYGETGQLSTVIGPDGVLQRYHYNRRGLLSSLERDNAPPVTFRYDDLDRLTERHIGHEMGVQVRRWEYDGVRESPSKVVYEDGSETQFGYDVEGNLTAVTDALGQRHQFRYGAFDNLLEATDPLGATVRYHYNAEAEFAGVTNSQGRDWTYGFDHSGRLSEERHYDGRIYRYHYDVADRLVQRMAPDGSALHYEHDASGRITRITARRADGETDGITELAYDVAGRLTKAVSPDAVVEYAYNRAGQVTSETVNGEAVQSGYDAGGQRAIVDGILAPLQLAWQSGRLSSLGIGSHQPLQFSHTAAGEEQRRSNGSGFALRHEWSPTGLLQRQALEGADGRVNDVLERRYQYDVLDRLTGITDSHWGEQAFRLNGAGQVTAERRDEGRRRQARLFGYDSEQNLCEVSQIAPGLGETLKVQDAVVQSSARYDAAGRVIERGHTQYRYDDCGRLAMKRETRPGFRPKETYFDWDVQDRLVRVSLPDGARWRYRYDAFGRRVNKVREGQVPSAQAVARVAYRWDGDQLIGQQQYRADGSAAREVQWVYEPGSFRPLAQVEAQGDSTQLHYIVTDLTGTARELCSEEGEIRWRGEQGLWGAHREERRPIPLRRYLGDAANEEVYCELRYQGQLYDAETGLYYNRHRYYDAESGQYLSPDPIGLRGGIHPQAYVHNPLEWIDPLGLSKYPGVDFSGTDALYQGGENTVKIKMTGGRYGDFKAANDLAGYNGPSGKATGKAHPAGYTWHHLDDYDPVTNESTMQLVKTEAHEKTFPHSGSVSQFEKHHGVEYESPEAKRIAKEMNKPKPPKVCKQK
ncbi:RHS repeat-associated core domain-containing protein [Pectobacterium peruviense]|uniref:RHS repeat-associated core domain-containing protein n=1 Tax=Pectobacterium peruviense TaxID=2066479 RepID=UPI0034A5199E